MDEKKYQQEDYIAISWFKKGIKDILLYFFWFLAFTQFVIVKRWYFIAIGLFLGMLLGYIYYMSKPTLYKVSMVVEFNELTKRTYAEMLDQLDRLSTTDTVSGLSSALHIPQRAAAKVLFIDSRNMNNDELQSDTSTRTEQPFKIIVGLKDNFLPDTLQNAILDYLNNSSYLRKIKEGQKKIYEEKIIFIDGELRKLDSLKLAYNKFLAIPNNSATFYNNAFNPADLYLQSNNLANQKESMLRWLALNTSAVYIVDGFKVTASPQSISLVGAILILGGTGLLIGFLIAFMTETKKRVSRT